MPQENQPSDPKRDRNEDSEPTSTTDATRLSETECDRKAMLFWCGAGKPEGQYPVYREAVERWSKAGAVEGEFDGYLKDLREAERRSRQSFWSRLPKSTAWPWITALVIPVLAVGVVFVEIQANRMFLQEQLKKNQESLEATFDVQREQNRQQVLKDYISQMTTLIAERDLVNKYPKNENGEYDSEGKEHPDAVAASSLTKTVLKLLSQKNKNTLNTPLNQERGALVLFLHESKLIQGIKTVVNLEEANLEGAYLQGAYLEEANLEGANLQGAYLDRVNLGRANLSRVNLGKANLIEARLDGASLIEANLDRANLIEVNLFQANLERANLEWAILTKGYLAEANLEGANLGRASLFKANLKGAKLRTYLGWARLDGANLEQANLEGARLDGANLENANLEQAKLGGANLGGVNLKRANLKGANLNRGNFFEGADFRDAKGLTDEQKAEFKSRGAIVR